MDCDDFSNVTGFAEYQLLTGRTAVYPPGEALAYVTLGLTNEVGEFAGKIKKWLRGDYPLDDPMVVNSLMGELGDSMWYLSQCCTELGVSLEDVAQMNLQKLADRQVRGVIRGNGDQR